MFYICKDSATTWIDLQYFVNDKNLQASKQRPVRILAVLLLSPNNSCLKIIIEDNNKSNNKTNSIGKSKVCIQQGSYGSWKTWKVLEFYYGKMPLVPESSGNLLNSTRNMQKCMEGSKEN